MYSVFVLIDNVWTFDSEYVEKWEAEERVADLEMSGNFPFKLNRIGKINLTTSDRCCILT